MASFCYLVLLLTLKSAFSAKIAGIAAFSSGSHYFVIRNAMEELTSRGHEVGGLNIIIVHSATAILAALANVE